MWRAALKANVGLDACEPACGIEGAANAEVSGEDQQRKVGKTSDL
jgi:hypothetical protein